MSGKKKRKKSKKGRRSKIEEWMSSSEYWRKKNIQAIFAGLCYAGIGMFLLFSVWIFGKGDVSVKTWFTVIVVIFAVMSAVLVWIQDSWSWGGGFVAGLIITLIASAIIVLCVMSEFRMIFYIVISSILSVSGMLLLLHRPAPPHETETMKSENFVAGVIAYIVSKKFMVGLIVYIVVGLVMILHSVYNFNFFNVAFDTMLPFVFYVYFGATFGLITGVIDEYNRYPGYDSDYDIDTWYSGMVGAVVGLIPCLFYYFHVLSLSVISAVILLIVLIVLFILSVWFGCGSPSFGVTIFIVFVVTMILRYVNLINIISTTYVGDVAVFVVVVSCLFGLGIISSGLNYKEHSWNEWVGQKNREDKEKRIEEERKQRERDRREAERRAKEEEEHRKREAWEKAERKRKGIPEWADLLSTCGMLPLDVFKDFSKKKKVLKKGSDGRWQININSKEYADLIGEETEETVYEPEEKKEEEIIDYYELFGVKPDATLQEIRQAYREKMKDYHPDIFMNSKTWVKKHANDMSKKFTEAYSVLSDKEKRREYDEKIGVS